VRVRREEIDVEGRARDACGGERRGADQGVRYAVLGEAFGHSIQEAHRLPAALAGRPRVRRWRSRRIASARSSPCAREPIGIIVAERQGEQEVDVHPAAAGRSAGIGRRLRLGGRDDEREHGETYGEQRTTHRGASFCCLRGGSQPAASFNLLIAVPATLSAPLPRPRFRTGTSFALPSSRDDGIVVVLAAAGKFARRHRGDGSCEGAEMELDRFAAIDGTLRQLVNGQEALAGRLDTIDGRLDKLEINQETMTHEVRLLAEAQAGVREEMLRGFADIREEFDRRLGPIETAVRRLHSASHE
jgi:hypothetical protein